MTNPVPLSFEPGREGHPSTHFDYNPEAPQCPFTLPGSGAEVLVASTRLGALAALSGADFSLAGASEQYAVTGAAFQSPEGMLRLDSPDITAIRRAIGPIFSETGIAKWRPRIEDAAKKRVAELETSHGPVDLATMYCEPFVADAVCLTTGIARKEWPKLLDLSERTLALVESPEDSVAISQAWSELYDFCGTVVSEKRAQPDGSIVSDVVAALDRAGLSDNQVLRACTTIINGFPTPTPVLSVAATELLRRPEVIAECLDNPDLWSPAADELMRLKAHFAFALPRIAMADVQVGDGIIEKGTVVVPSLRAAAYDPARTQDPEQFDMSRKSPRSIVFGAGSHFCPGAALTRQWLETGLRVLFETMPTLHLATDDLKWQPGSLSVPETIPVSI